MIKVINAIDLNDLQVKCLGYHHDHCSLLYFGKAKNLPNKYKKYLKQYNNYYAIIDEEIIN